MACPSCQDIDVAQPQCQRRRCIACPQTNHFAVHEEICDGKQNACVGCIKGHVQWRTGGGQSGSKRRRGRPRRSPNSVYAAQKSYQHSQKAAATLAAIHRRRCMRTGDTAGIFCCWFILGFGVALTFVFLSAERSDGSAFNAEYRPRSARRVTTGLDPAVHGDARRLRRHGETERAGSRHGLPDQVRQ
jgi:hypothetical protein